MLLPFDGKIDRVELAKREALIDRLRAIAKWIVPFKDSFYRSMELLKTESC